MTLMAEIFSSLSLLKEGGKNKAVSVKKLHVNIVDPVTKI